MKGDIWRPSQPSPDLNYLKSTLSNADTRCCADQARGGSLQNMMLGAWKRFQSGGLVTLTWRFQDRAVQASFL